jgi:hypothetical protein
MALVRLHLTTGIGRGCVHEMRRADAMRSPLLARVIAAAESAPADPETLTATLTATLTTFPNMRMTRARARSMWLVVGLYGALQKERFHDCWNDDDGVLVKAHLLDWEDLICSSSPPARRPTRVPLTSFLRFASALGTPREALQALDRHMFAVPGAGIAAGVVIVADESTRALATANLDDALLRTLLDSLKGQGQPMTLALPTASLTLTRQHRSALLEGTLMAMLEMAEMAVDRGMPILASQALRWLSMFRELRAELPAGSSVEQRVRDLFLRDPGSLGYVVGDLLGMQPVDGERSCGNDYSYNYYNPTCGPLDMTLPSAINQEELRVFAESLRATDRRFVRVDELPDTMALLAAAPGDVRNADAVLLTYA